MILIKLNDRLAELDLCFIIPSLYRLWWFGRTRLSTIYFRWSRGLWFEDGAVPNLFILDS